jgi:hypothetical protein
MRGSGIGRADPIDGGRYLHYLRAAGIQDAAYAQGIAYGFLGECGHIGAGPAGRDPYSLDGAGAARPGWIRFFHGHRAIRQIPARDLCVAGPGAAAFWLDHAQGQRWRSRK